MTPGMQSSSLPSRISVEDDLAGEDGTEVRHESIDGEVCAMGGASDRHGSILSNLVEGID